MSRIIQADQLRAGDFILFLTDKGPKPKGWKDKAWWLLFGLIGYAIKRTTNSKYTHAAICYDAETIAEASKFGLPVGFGKIQNAVNYCKYAAVFRSSWAFTGGRVKKLQMFLDRIVEEGVPYNLRGLIKYLWRRKAHYESQQERLEAFFNGQAAPGSFDKGPYFCSELVAACFHAIGAIDPSAAVIYDPRFASPADLVTDNTYGTFLGYLIPSVDTVIPENDEFYNKELLSAEMGGI
jgi:hypothetical protein